MRKVFIIVLLSTFLYSQIPAKIFIRTSAGIESVAENPGIRFIELIIGSENRDEQSRQIIKYGKQRNFLDKTGVLTEGSGRQIIFNVQIDAINFFKENGWIMVSSFSECKNSSRSDHFLFQKEK